MLNFLKNSGEGRKSRTNNWFKLGRGQDAFRVLFQKKGRKKLLYCLFVTDGEHQAYERFFVNNPPERCDFVAY